MASKSVRVYLRTGYNYDGNIPDSPDRLEAENTYVDLPALNILQDWDLPEVLVKQITSLSDDDVEHIDYCKIGKEYYKVYAPHKVGTDVIHLDLDYDGVTSAGGASKLTYLGGITSRATTASDEFGEFSEDDELITPNKPLILLTEWEQVKEAENNLVTSSVGDADPVFLESTIDLPKTVAQCTAKSFETTESGDIVTVPEVFPIGTEKQTTTESFYQVTSFGVGLQGSALTGFNPIAKFDNQTAVYLSNGIKKATGHTQAGEEVTYVAVSDMVKQGLVLVQGLGVAQGSILAQWRVPREFIQQITDNVYVQGSGHSVDDNITGEGITLIVGCFLDIETNLSPNYASVKNKRLLYGEYNKYGLLTCAGNSGEFKPEDVTTENHSPTLSVAADVRSSGRPYYRFKYINGSDSDFWRNCVAGAQWENVPLIYQGATGNILDRVKFLNEEIYDVDMMNLSRQSYSLQDRQALHDYVGNAFQQAQNLTQPETGTMTINGGSPQSYYTGRNTLSPMSAIQLGYGMRGEALNQQGRNLREQVGMRQMMHQFNSTDLSLNIATKVYAPSLNFPFNADIVRDMTRNKVLLYKYRMSDADLTRLDKLLTMYGYKESEPISSGNFSRRIYFDYVSATGVEIGGDLPMWKKAKIAQQLSNGVRVWHVKPDPKYYTEGNPIKENS